MEATSFKLIIAGDLIPPVTIDAKGRGVPPLPTLAAPGCGCALGGASEALGRIIVENAAFLRFSTAWAAIIIAAALGIAFYLIIIALERVVMPWHASVRGREV